MADAEVPPRVRRIAKLAWRVPLVGTGLVFFFGAGLSLMNLDIRGDVQTGGLAALAMLAAAGLALSFLALRRSRAAGRGRGRLVLPGLVISLLLATGVVAGAGLVHRWSRRPATPLLRPIQKLARPVAGPVPVWIDTDAACGTGAWEDVDDCWALVAALRSPELDLRGVSTIFGNVKGATALEVTRELIGRFGGERPPPVFRGAGAPLKELVEPPPAVAAMAAALRAEPLVVIAQGPATNVAALLRVHPDLAPRIRRVVLVAGRRPGHLFHPGTQWWFHFSDFNHSQDVAATAELLDSGVPLTLVPFELATGLTITEEDVDRLLREPGAGRWLAQASASWLRFWRKRLHREGFYPFDLLAVGYVTSPQLFDCRITRARIGFSLFLAPLRMGRDLEVGDSLSGPRVEYCVAVRDRFKEGILDRLAGSAPAG